MQFRLGKIIRAAMVVLLLAFVAGDVTIGVVAGKSAHAQTQGQLPGVAGSGPNDAETWRAIRRGGRGTVSLPEKRAGYMIQSTGQDWRSWRNVTVFWFGVIVIGGTLAALALFYALRGPIRIESGFSGRLVERFNNLERFAHWLTATSFVVLGLSGLNMMYGRFVIKPLIGPDAFSALSEWGKYGHNFLGFAFIAGIVLTLVIWVRDNVPDKLDVAWLMKGGGLFSKGVHPPARKFNAGQKILFWLVVLAGASLSFSGLVLLFPLTFAPFGWAFSILAAVGIDVPAQLTAVQEMQLTQLWHAILSLIMIAVILAHIYIGWLGMEGAYDAMGTGYVDENWAREHHSLWVAEAGSAPSAPSAEPSGTPAGQSGDA